MKDISIREFEYGSDYYIQELELRNKILRKPLELDLYSEDLSQDAKDIHIGAFDGEKLVGCLLLLKVDDKTLKMRQVAVDEGYRGLGIGKRMVIFAEKTAVERGFATMTMHARKTAIDFYKKLGYIQLGSEFIEVRVPHFKMEKNFYETQ